MLCIREIVLWSVCIYIRRTFRAEIIFYFKSYCLPFLLYASEAVSPSHSIVHSIDNCINQAIVKIFHVTSSDCVQNFRLYAILLAYFKCGT